MNNGKGGKSRIGGKGANGYLKLSRRVAIRGARRRRNIIWRNDGAVRSVGDAGREEVEADDAAVVVLVVVRRRSRAVAIIHSPRLCKKSDI